ncbi:uncharacterized protein BX663DRAFT_518991 [Cokeromyces recurvatus]|uniref:uncharacterized protein n=1 Tax=Cokeromyces recurvatus TaxID=90255 RepID=UPI00221F5CFC|nr:uncharacterized protein BX663DRAFT_518991 [Cokeromyces recurvatus]KAI7899927.1 hypothetical protein BX663DRAFT_518991 [Cokeromyces recurvatus]
MDNFSIHKHVDIRKYTEAHGYGCFWSVFKSKVKREILLEEETLSENIREAYNSVLVSDLQGFCRHSLSRFEDCSNNDLSMHQFLFG